MEKKLTNQEKRTKSGKLPIALLLSILVMMNLASCKDDTATQKLDNNQPKKVEEPQKLEQNESAVAEEPVESKNADAEIDLSKLPNASEAQPGERCVPDDFPYYSFVMPEGYEVNYTQNRTEFGEIAFGSLQYDYVVEADYDWAKTSDMCGSHIVLHKIGASEEYTIRLNYIFYGNLTDDVRLQNKLITSQCQKIYLDEDLDFMTREYEENSFTVKQDDKLDSILVEKIQAGIKFQEENPELETTDVYDIYPNKAVGFLGISSGTNEETLADARAILESMSPPTFSETDAERVLNEMRNIIP
jgi:hypothetical protein